MSMKQLGFWLSFACMACGGRSVDTGEGSDNGQGDGSESVAGAGKKGSSGPGTPLPQQTLGECKPGFERGADRTRPCNWVDEAGRCFDVKDAACACICPRDADSVCWSSSYGGPNSATRVHCK